MNRQNSIFSLLILFLLLSVSYINAGEVKREKISFDDNWSFHLGDINGAENISFDDNMWRRLNLPHDWAIEGDFSKDNPSGTGGGALPGGMGWYRKSFKLSKEDIGKKIYIDFDGVYMNAEVFINGRSLGIRPYGYISFSYDLTPYIYYDKINTIAVKVDNQEQPNSRWYSGCGIYRNVWLTKVNKTHIDLWGVFVSSNVISEDKAILSIKTSVKNDELFDNDFEIKTILTDAKGKNIADVKSKAVCRHNQVSDLSQTLSINNPILWSIDNPYLYKVRTEIIKKGKVIDNYETFIGIRSYRFDSRFGFSLNGKPMKIKGVCLHHDLGCLGSAINERAIERQLQLIKDMGCNAIRMSHNPPSPEILALCDKMGFIVMDEAFDMWRKRKTSHDYSRYFDKWYQRDLSDLIKRDRNHPSVIMWSIGNEVLEQWTDATADTLSLEQANMILNFGHKGDESFSDTTQSVNSLLCRHLVDIVKNIDNTRPVTSGCNEPGVSNHLFRSRALDIIGYNYHLNYIPKVPVNFEGKPFIITESVSALMTRGYYRMPSDSVLLCPERWDKPYYDSSFSCSSYDNCHAPWGSTHEEALNCVKKYPFVCGQFIWTGFDYLGEPTPYGWPARSSYFGIIDLAGFPKDIYYMYESEWTDKTVLHLFPHWNWNIGQTVDMWAYYNNADEVELFINGHSQGIRKKANDEYHVMWRVKFEPGVVKVVSRKDGNIVAEKEIHTAGKPYALRITPDRNKISYDGKDLSFITVKVVDKDGNLCPLADNLVNFKINGSGFIAGVDNGSPISLESFKKPYRKAFYGKCLVVLQNNATKGHIELIAESEGLKGDSTIIECK